MVPSRFQSAPTLPRLGIAQILCTAPSARVSLRSSPPAKKPMDRPSGDQNGSLGPLRPGQWARRQGLEGPDPEHGLDRGARRAGRLGQEHDLASVGRGDRPAEIGEGPALGRVGREARRRRSFRHLPQVDEGEAGREAGRHEQGHRPRPALAPAAALAAQAASWTSGAGVAGSAGSARDHLLQLEPSSPDVGQPHAAGPCAGSGSAAAGPRAASPSAARRGPAPPSPPPRSRPSPCRRRRARGPSASPTAARRTTTRRPACRPACPAPARATCRPPCPGSPPRSFPCGPASATATAPPSPS